MTFHPWVGDGGRSQKEPQIAGFRRAAQVLNPTARALNAV
jgi:hypothetical protein